MSDIVSPCEKKSMEYDTPRSNPYTALNLSTMVERSREGKGGKPQAEYTAVTAAEKTDPIYAAPDEMSVFNNTAYGATGSLSLQTEPNIYTTMDGLKKNGDEVSVQTSIKVDKRGLTYHRALFCTICTVLLFLSVGLASAALVMVVLRSDPTQSCNCVQNTETLNLLNTFQDQLDRTSRALERSQEETRMLASAVAELSENASALSVPATTAPTAAPTTPTVPNTAAPTTPTVANTAAPMTPTVPNTAALTTPTVEGTGPPSTNITRVLHNCTTREEATCHIQPGQRACQTPCVSEVQQGSVAINFQCTRLESAEPNPLIGILDVTGGEAICLCYLVDINGNGNGQSTHGVDCALRVTRCTLVDLQG